MAALLALGAAACGDDDDDSDGGSASGGAPARTAVRREGSNDGPVTIVASVPPTDHGWLGAISKNAQEAADQYDDVDFRLLEAADADSQAQQIEQVISDKPDALVVLPQDGEALTPVAQKAEAAGIPVINVDRLFTSPDAATATILGDNYQIGVSAADYIAEELNCEGNVVEIQGLAGISVTEERTQGLRRPAQEGLPRWRHRDRRQAAGRLQPGHRPEGDGEHPPGQDQIDAVYTHDDDMAQGVVQAIRNSGRDDEMFLTGVGGSQDAMAQIKEGGLYRADLPLQPEHGRLGGEHGAPDRPRRGLRGARPAGGPAPGHRARGDGHPGERRGLRGVRVQLGRSFPGHELSARFDSDYGCRLLQISRNFTTTEFTFAPELHETIPQRRGRHGSRWRCLRRPRCRRRRG